MADLQGPYIKTGYLKDHKPIELKKGSYIKIVHDISIEGNENVIASSHPIQVNVGDTFDIADGSLSVEVKEVDHDFIEVKILNDFVLTEK